MAFNQHNKSVNVDRIKMIESIKSGLVIHETAYNEAMADFKEYAVAEATKFQAAIAGGNFTKLHISLTPPVSHIQEYKDAIEIFEMSVDQNINVDIETFKAYFKNEWPWSRQFLESATMYKSAIGG